jgi:hypothetical protein
MIQLMILRHLPRQFIQHLTRQLHTIIVMFLELYELHQISYRLVTLEICHLHVIVIQLVHYTPVVSITNSNHYYTQWQLSTFY